MYGQHPKVASPVPASSEVPAANAAFLHIWQRDKDFLGKNIAHLKNAEKKHRCPSPFLIGDCLAFHKIHLSQNFLL